MAVQSPSPPGEEVDVVVVGGRCAGAPLAGLLAQAGLRVVVIEQATFPRPVLSSNLMEADALDFLRRFGVDQQVRATGVRFLRVADIRLNNVQFRMPFPVRFDDQGGAVFLQRHLLDRILADRAAELGADVRQGAKMVELLWSGHRVGGVRVRQHGREIDIRARLVVGADGRSSSVAFMAGARKYHVLPNQRSYYFTLFEGAAAEAEEAFVFHRWGDRMVWGGAADSGLYLVGVSPEAHERDYFRSNAERGLLAHMRSCAPMSALLMDARPATKIFGIRNFEGYFREATGPGWVLAGDAGHFKDPSIGRGIGDAFVQAETLAAVIIAGLDSPQAQDAGRQGLDEGLRRWGRWRDSHFEGHYWLAYNLGVRGVLPQMVAEAVGQRRERGELRPFFDLFAHRVSYDEVFAMRRLGTATMSAVGSAGANPLATGWQAAQLLGRELGRRWRRRARVLGPPELRTAPPAGSPPGLLSAAALNGAGQPDALMPGALIEGDIHAN
jgi:flavin-dependent dehydrogenase